MATNAYYLNQFISTTLSTAGGIDDSQTTGITITSVTGVETTKPGIICLSYSDPIDISKAEWISYTSIDVSNELQGVTRGAEGFSAKAHSNGATVAFPISESHINNLNNALIIDATETNLLEGVLDEDDMASDSATKGATQQSIKAYSDSATQTLTNKTLTSPVLNMGDSMPSTNARALVGDISDNLSLTSTFQTVVFITETEDTGSDYNTSTGQFTVPVSGYYIICCHLRIASVSLADNVQFVLACSTSNDIFQDYIATTESVWPIVFSHIVKLVASETVEFQIKNATASRGIIVDVSGDGYNRAEFHLLSI